MSSSDQPSLDSEARLPEWGPSGEFSGSDPDLAAPCPANSDSELTPDEIDAMPDAYNVDAPLIDGYSREFWDYGEYCRRFGYVSGERDDADITPRADDTAIDGSRRCAVDEYALRTGYRISADTGEVLYDNEEESDELLATLLGKSDLFGERGES